MVGVRHCFELGTLSESSPQNFTMQQESHSRSNDDLFQYMVRRRRQLQVPVGISSSQDSGNPSSGDNLPVTPAQVNREDSSTIGSRPGERLGSERPQITGHMLAMLRRAHGLRERVQRLWELDRLRALRDSMLLHPEDGIYRTPHPSDRSQDGGNGTGHVEVRSQQSKRLQGLQGSSGTLHHRGSIQEREAGAGDEQERCSPDFVDAAVSRPEVRQAFELSRPQSNRSSGHFVLHDPRGVEPSQERCSPEEAGTCRSREGVDPCAESSLNMAHHSPQIEDSTKKVDFSAVVGCVELPADDSSDGEMFQDAVVPEDLHAYTVLSR